MNTKAELIDRDDEGFEGPVELDTTVANQLRAAEVNAAMNIARRYPRSIASFLKAAETLATHDEEVAASCMYSVPRGGKRIVGPSIRFAELLFNAFGNCQVQSRIIDTSGSFITVQGMFHDSERNTTVATEVQRRITHKDGTRYNEDMIIMTANAASSIAKRNAILAGIPKALWNSVYRKAEQTAIGKNLPLAQRRTNLLQAYGLMQVTPEQIFIYLGVKGIEDVGIEQLLELAAIRAQIKDGDLNIDDVFNGEVHDRDEGRKPKDSALNNALPAPKSQEPLVPQQQRQEQEPEPARSTKKASKEAAKEPAKEPSKESPPAPSPMQKFKDMINAAKSGKEVDEIRAHFLGKGAPYQFSDDDRQDMIDKCDYTKMDLDAAK